MNYSKLKKHVAEQINDFIANYTEESVEEFNKQLDETLDNITIYLVENADDNEYKNLIDVLYQQLDEKQEQLDDYENAVDNKNDQIYELEKAVVNAELTIKSLQSDIVLLQDEINEYAENN